MDNDDPRSPSSRLRRNRLPISGSQPPSIPQSPQHSAASVSDFGYDQCSESSFAIARGRNNLENHPESLRVPPTVQRHQITETPLQELSIESIMQSASPVRTWATFNSPDTLCRSSPRGSESTIPYSTDCTPIEPKDIENAIQAQGIRGHPESSFLEAKSTRLETDSSDDDSQSRIGLFQKDPKISSQARQARHVDNGSSGSSVTASVTSSRLCSQKISQVSGEAKAISQSEPLVELFPFTRARLDNPRYRQPKTANQTENPAENPRRRMLKVVFGWDLDIEDLIQDEWRRHPFDSVNAILLSKWLGDTDADITAKDSALDTPSTSHRMFLALSKMNGQPMTKEVGRTLARKMLKKGDIHLAASTLIGVGEPNDAIEMYTSHLRYMEAILLTCIEFPNDFARQSALVRNWGEHIMLASRQLLAIRCLWVTNTTSSDSWTSLNAEIANVLSKYTQELGLMSPTLPVPTKSSQFPHPPTIGKTPQKSALKIITSLETQDRRPVEFIGHEARPGSQLAANGLAVPMACDGVHQQILLTIGETSTEPGSASGESKDLRRYHHKTTTRSGNSTLLAKLSGSVQQSSTSTGSKPRKDTPHPDSKRSYRTPDEMFKAIEQELQPRNGFKDLKPEGLKIQSSPPLGLYKVLSETTLSHTDSDTNYQSNGSKCTAGSRGERRVSPPPTGQSFASTGSQRSPLSDTDRTWKIDQFIDSLHPAIDYPQPRQPERPREPQPSSKPTEQELERGRTSHRTQLAERSPSSPVTMSHELHEDPPLQTRVATTHTAFDPHTDSKRPSNSRRHHRPKARAGSEPGYHRRTHLPRHNLERPNSLEKDKPREGGPSANHRRHRHGRDGEPPRENCVIRDKKDYQRRVGRQKLATDHYAPREDAVHGLGVTSHELKMAEQRQNVSAELQSRNRAPSFQVSLNRTTPPPFFTQHHSYTDDDNDSNRIDAPSDYCTNGIGSLLLPSTSPESTPSYQGSSLPYAGTQSTQSTSHLEESLIIISDLVDGTSDPIPRPSSCPASPIAPLLRRYDLGIHPAFHRNIRPSSFKPGSTIPARRDPSRGRNTSIREAWELLDAIEDAPSPATDSVTTVVADEPLPPLPPSRTATPAAGHRAGRSFNDGITNKFKAMADRVRSPSRGRKEPKVKPTSTELTGTTAETSSISFKAMADRVRSPSRGRRDLSSSSEIRVPYLPVAHPPYESLPAISRS